MTADAGSEAGDDRAPGLQPPQSTDLHVRAHWYTPAEASRLLGISETAVRKRVASGTLTGIRVGRSWRILLPGEAPEADTTPPVAHAPVLSASAGKEEVEGLLALVRELQRQNLALAGHIGFLQHQLTQAQAETKQIEGRRDGAVEHDAAVTRGEHEAVLQELTNLRAMVSRYMADVARLVEREAPPQRRWWRFWAAD